MSKSIMKKNARVEEVYNLFVEHMKRFLKEANLNHEEYTNFVTWADRLGREGELPLFADVFFESHVLRAMYTDKPRSEEHTSELQSRGHLVCRLLLEKTKHKQR